MYCAKCGNNINDNEQRCPVCGEEVVNRVYQAEVVSDGTTPAPVAVMPTPAKKSKKALIIVISVVSTLVLFGILLTAGFVVLNNAGYFKRDMTIHDVYKISSNLENGKEYEISDFKKYEAEIRVSVYRTYTYEIEGVDDDRVVLIVTTDKENKEIKEMVLFCGSNYINLKEGKDAVQAFAKENIIWYDFD